MNKSKIHKFIWPISFGLIVLSWLPAYLAYYPAICSYDTGPQLRQIITDNYIEHHPIIHTLIIKLFLMIGKNVLGNPTAGFGLYALLQMLILAGVFSWAVYRMDKRWNSFGTTGILQAFCMFYPFHWYMAVTMTKDVLFTAFFVLFIISLMELAYTEFRGGPVKELQNGDMRKNILLFAGSCVGLILFRSNAKYALLALLVILVLEVLCLKRKRAVCCRILVYAAVGFIVGNLLLTLLFRVTDATQGDRREMLSMPIQQLARVMVYHGGAGMVPEDDNTLAEEEKALINEFLLDEAWKEYDPYISDPVKRHTNTYVVRYRTKDFLKVYLGLLKRYPKDYVQAFLDTNAGYFFPWDSSHKDIYHVGDSLGYGYVQTVWSEELLAENGIFSSSKFPWLFHRMEEWAGRNLFSSIPILKYIFVPGVWLWAYLIMLVLLISRRGEQRRLFLPVLFILIYFGTLLLGPTVQMRYLYPLITVFPFLAVCLLSGLREARKNPKD